MSYEKMMKWNKKNRKGISYKKSYMGFNPSGITSEQIKEREKIFINEMKLKSIEERKEYWNNAQKIIKNITGSWAWEWCAFERNFVLNGEVY